MCLENISFVSKKFKEISKEYLEGLYQMMDDIDTGIVKTVPAEDVLKRMKELVDDMEDE